MSTRTRRAPIARLIVLAAAPIFLSDGVVAQTPTGFSPLSVFQLADRQDWVLRASMTSGASIVGRVREIDDISARLEGGRVPFAELELLERGDRYGSGAQKGAVIGGAALGAAAAVLLFWGPLAAGSGEEFLAGLSIGVGLGAIGGGLIGAALSPAEMRWRPIWPGGSPAME